jgi:hypothetical protein
LRQQRDLHLRRSRITLMGAIFADDFFFHFSC